MYLKKRIILSFTLCISIIFSLLMLYVKSSVEKNYINYTETQTINLMESKGNEVGQWFFNKITEFRVLSKFPGFRTMDIRSISPLMDSLTKSYSTTGSHSTEILGVGSLDGTSWVNGKETLELIDRETFLKVLSTDKEFIINSPEISPYNGKDMFMIYYPILNYNGEKEGLLYGGIPTANLIKMISEINTNNTITWVMDSNGTVFTHNENYFLNQVLNENQLNHIIRSAENKKSSTVGISNSTVVYSHIPYSDGWLLCTMIDNDSIHKHTNALLSQILIFWALLLIMSILAAYFLSNSIVKPLNELKENMKNVENGKMILLPLGDVKDDFYHFKTSYNSMLEKISELIDTIYAEQTKKRKAELMVLQSQINPHFLYNTLDTLKWIALDYDAFEISDIVSSLSSFFRISLSDGNEIITLEDEFQHSRHYLEIQQIRYADILEYDMVMDEAIAKTKTLKIILQPLIENALYHGLKNKDAKGFIGVYASLSDDTVSITIVDNGVGISEDKLKEIQYNLDNNIQSEHYGLYNINERLKISYGNNSSLDISSIYGVKTEITIKFPFNI